MARFFNTAGVVEADRHYCVDPLSRLDLAEVLELIESRKYFALHAPRQTGKTTCLKALVSCLNQAGRHRACYLNVEGGQGGRERVEEAFRTIAGELVSRADDLGEKRLEALLGTLSAARGPVAAFAELLKQWARLDDKPLVLLIDEVDSLVGDTLITFLRQLRAGYDRRPASFPSSVILCGVRDVRDYRLFSSAEKTVIAGGSAFNIKSESLRLGDFSRAEVEDLLGQHTQQTGQLFRPDAVQTVWDLSLGQPWLVNALADQACFRDPSGRDRSRPIDLDRIAAAKETLVLRRDSHVDQLADRLREDRVRRVVQPILLGARRARFAPDDLEYCTDLGLIRSTPRGPAIANPVYREVIPRALTAEDQETFKADFAPDWILPDGRLDTRHLLETFQAFYRENGESWIDRFAYREAGHQLMLQAFLQRVVNGSGIVEREYALGSGRADLLIRWKHPRGEQRIVFELKILHKSLSRTLAEGQAQLSEYAERCAAHEAHLVVFHQKRGFAARRAFRKKRLKGRDFFIWSL